MRSLPGKTSGCSMIPAATTTWSARNLSSWFPTATGTKPYSKRPIAIAGAISSTPAASARCLSSAASRVPVAIGEQPTADVVALVDDRDRSPIGGGRDRCLETSGAATDDEHADVAILDLDPLGAAPVRVEDTEPGCVAEELLVQRPELARPDERLVVEAGWRERASELVGHLHQVALERADVVLSLDDGALGHRGRADPHVRDPVHRHLAVRAVPRAALKPARPVVLERAREHALPRGVQRGADRVACERLHRLAARR